MLKIDVKAPGKTILHGEHAVVYGKAAIAASLGLRTHVTLTLHSETTVQLHLNMVKLELAWDIETLKCCQTTVKNPDVHPPTELELEEINNFMTKVTSSSRTFTEFQKLAVLIFLYLYRNITSTYDSSFFQPCVINVDSELSVGAGMGSSASYSVCLATALLAATKKINEKLSSSDLDLISRWAFCAETICHGHPSGIDNSICTYGGALLFEKGKVCEKLSNMPPIEVLLVNTGVTRNTKVLVAKVKQKQNTYSSVIPHVLDAIHAVSIQCWELLKHMTDSSNVVMHMPTLQELVRMNQHLLNCLGVGHTRLDDIYQIANAHACSAKLTGAGGGGCAIVLLNSEKDNPESKLDALKSSLTSRGFQFWEVLLGGPGVQLDILRTEL